MKLYTIGFTKKTARQFFEILKRAGIKTLVDIRLNNRSQLAGFTKKEDLEYFLQAICGASYNYLPSLAPTQEILDNLKKHKGTWTQYETRFQDLMRERGAIEKVDKQLLGGPSCLLCSEPTAEHCHRRLVAEALTLQWPDIEITHL
jgi:uncharacterized protein (DUF488 family)